MILVAIIGVSSVVCVIIICVGVTWLCRYLSMRHYAKTLRHNEYIFYL